MSRFQGDSLAEMQRSLVPPATTRLTGRQIDGAPVYEYVRAPGAPPVSVQRFSTSELPAASTSADYAHAHDFLVMAYCERGGGSFRIGTTEWPLTTGDAFVIAPGEVVRFSDLGHRATAEGWCVFFPPGIIASEAPGGSLGWRAHPLLFRFVGHAADGAQRLPVPAGERAAWSEHVQAIERELREPRDGSAEAALSHLTLLLVSAARISVDIGEDFRLRSEPLLAAVFEFIEDHHHEPISLATVAADVGLTPGYLTTLVRRKTGRSVQRWITERRMASARTLLRETDLTVEAVAARTGYRQPGLFIKHFRRDHAVTPAAWRRQTRARSESVTHGTATQVPALVNRGVTTSTSA
jgi:AraC-like DNA-binding protein/quercetin dioxygenase-like cupin family protein